MELPEDSIGITDLIAHGECPRRMSYGMRRHTARGEQSDTRTPEAGTYATAYGSAIHEVLAAVEDGLDDDAAVQRAWNLYGSALEPRDLELLHVDLATFRSRTFPGAKIVAAEDEFRVPLFTHQGRTIYFRFKLDLLLQRLDNPGVFIHVDYKSSRHAKSESEVHSDPQMWAYNWGIHERFPECEQLIQVYDQLRFGQVTTRKSESQRGEIHGWLKAAATAVLDDDAVRSDGLLAPRFNRWCPWCPVLESCPVVGELSEWASTRIAALAPREPKKNKDGSDSKRMVDVPLEPARLPEYVAEMEKAATARQVLERFEGSVKDLLRELPALERAQLGYDLRPRSNSVFGPRALEAIHARFGDRFYELAKVTKSGLESGLGDDEAALDWAIGLAERVNGPPSVVKVKSAA